MDEGIFYRRGDWGGMLPRVLFRTADDPRRAFSGGTNGTVLPPTALPAVLYRAISRRLPIP